MTSLPLGLSMVYCPPLLKAVAGFDLPSAAPGHYPSTALSDQEWQELAATVATHKVWSLLARAIQDGMFPATELQAEQAFESDELAVLASLYLDRALIAVDAAFKSEGLDARVFKGVAHALLCYPDPGMRTYSDIDLFVTGTAFDHATKTLESMGARRHNPEGRRGYTASFGKSAGFSLPDGWEIDLHRSPQDGPFGAAIDTTDLFRNPQTILVGTTPIQTPSAPVLFLTACYHAILPADVRRVLPLRDVAQALTIGMIDCGDVLEIAARWQGLYVVSSAVCAAGDFFGLSDTTPLLGWARRYQPSARERRWLAAYHDPRPRSSLALTAYTAEAYPTLKERLRFLEGQVFHEGRDPLATRLARVARIMGNRRPSPP